MKVPLNILDGLYDGSISCALRQSDGLWTTSRPGNSLILSGSFNPLHEGHIQMLSAAEKMTGKKGIYEISICNVDKPVLPKSTLLNRIKCFPPDKSFCVTASPRFTEKSTILPGSTFVIGYDTATRLLDPKYYKKKDFYYYSDAVVDALNMITENHCSFIVGGRIDELGQFKTLGDLKMPKKSRQLFELLPESEFRIDISSSEIRKD